MDQETIFNRLGISHSEQYKVLITLKSRKYKPFVALVSDFNYDEDDTKAIFSRSDETVFPSDTDEVKNDQYMTYLKNIKQVDRYREKKTE